jgi:hypothetical protein
LHICNKLYYVVCRKAWGTLDHDKNGKTTIEARDTFFDDEKII